MTRKFSVKLNFKANYLWLLFALLMAMPGMAWAADVVPNGAFDSTLDPWINTATVSSGSRTLDSSIFGQNPNSFAYITNVGRRQTYTAYDVTDLTGTINAADTVTLSFYWYKTASVIAPDWNDIVISILLPGGGETELWSENSVPAAGQVLDGNVVNLDVSNLFTLDGTYQLKISGNLRSGRDTSGQTQFNLDDIVLDVQGAANNPPVITSGSTEVSLTPVNRYGLDTTVLSATFSDADAPGVGAFNATFKIREPDNSTELTLVNNQPNGSGGLTITDNGGGSYTASYSFDPTAGQNLGLYDLYFEVSDGTDNAIDDYTANADELEIYQQIPPSVSPGASSFSISPINRFGANTTVMSTVFNDIDQPGVAAFNVTMKIREPDNATEIILVNNQPHGAGGLTITDNGGGSYTASYTYNPDDAQTLGLYDVYFDVSDGSGSGVDDYTDNLDELEITQQVAPSVVSGASAVSVSPINRIGTSSTIVSVDYTDIDEPGVGAFIVTMKIREPDNVTELTLVNAQTNGNGGLSITDNGGGSYTASYAYDPIDSQNLGLYDLYVEVNDGTDSFVDDYSANLDELEIMQQNAPALTSGTTAFNISPVNRYAANSTVMSATFTDADQPGVGAFTVTMKIREPDNSTEVVLVNAQTTGNGGLVISDGGGGSYTASFTYNPDDAQVLGLYDLYFEVYDGFDTTVDDYTSNVDELEIIEILPNVPPSIISGATLVSISPVNRNGASTTTVSAAFTDTDAAGIGDFIVSFKIREPDNTTELILVNAQTNGNGGLTITDGGGGSYTASYVYNPDDAQNLGLYDLYCEISDGSDSAVDDFSVNIDELEIIHTIPNNPPALVAGATQISTSPVNRYGTNTTTISSTFTDADSPGTGAFTVSFKVREPDNTTELILVDAQTSGNGGLTITDGGGGSYTASYVYNPDDAQNLGLYDLSFEVSDGTDAVVDDYSANTDELEINETLPAVAPVVAAGATFANPASVQRLDLISTTISTTFSDANEPGVGAFTVSFKIREPDNATEVVLVNAQSNGNGGLTITDLGGGVYTASYDYDPGDAQLLGLYDLYFEVDDGGFVSTDDYVNNIDELEITLAPNSAPTLIAGATSVSPVSLDRAGLSTTELSVTFTDLDEPGIAGFFVSFTVTGHFGSPTVLIADALQSGQSGLLITDDGVGDYTATISWDPPDDQLSGYYHLSSQVSDGNNSVTDNSIDNQDELLITTSGENSSPVVPADAVFASPAGVERIGAYSTTIAATFLDADVPPVGDFLVTIMLREPDDSTEIVLANALGHGTGGLVITDDGGGVYTASIDWDPADTQTIGLYDIYFLVSDGIYVGSDSYINNENELEIFDAVSNQVPTMTPNVTYALPASVTRLGTEYTMLQSIFTDLDIPGPGDFSVTFSVRDESNVEYTIVNGAANGEQGLRILSQGGGQYQASVLWDPPVGQVTGTYDLYFIVVDGRLGAVGDGYENNQEELTITATAVAGDGNLLHRNNDANSCGGANSACHNIADHMGNDCLTCHVPHGTRNIFMVRESITTPSSGIKTVLFKTLGIGDPDNDPDPVAGDPDAGAMADDSNGVYTGVCEVCHTSTKYHRNDGSQTLFGHKNVNDCTSCHPHADGFAGSGESDGGAACSCHSAEFDPMNTSTSSYHHMINSDVADYTIASKTCLMCHVDHDIFRSDLNPGVGNRAKNLRMDTTTPVVQGNNSVLLDSDYTSSGTGGICLSCHTSVQVKGYVQPDGSTQTPALSKSSFDAATSAHNYNVTSTFPGDGSTFKANCTKCHNDTQTKSYQDVGNQFGTHDSPYRTLINPLGLASPVDPLEENFCMECHSTANPNAGSNLDFFGVQSMTLESINIGQTQGYTYRHPVGDFSGRHSSIEDGTDLGDGNRHSECVDCHNVHEADQGTHDGSSNLVSNALKGVWGVEPTSWPAAPTPTDNGILYVTPSGYNRVEPAQKEYQICLKCHSDYTTLPVDSPNLAEEINPNYESTHGIVSPGTNAFCNSSTMSEPWASSKTNYCSDCHRSDNSSDPAGPHGSNMEHLLVATAVSDDVVGTPLCTVCHLYSVYWDGSATPSAFDDHPATQGAHQRPEGCFACHMWEFSQTAGLGVNTTSGMGAGKIHVHGMNKKFVYNEQDGSTGLGQNSDAFVDGYVEDMDFVGKSCWSSTCKTHSNKAY